MIPAERVLRARARLGEGPAWDAATGTLWWVDIYGFRVHRYHPAMGEERAYDTGETVGFALPAADGRLIVGLKRHLAFLDPRDGSLERVAEIALDAPESRLNDAAVDGRGRLWFGTMSRHDGGATLHRFSEDEGMRVMETGLTIANGMGWSPDGRTFYLTDSPARKIYAYDFDLARGTIASRRVFAELVEERGFPDGLAVDAEGGVWSARFDGGCVVRYAPDGRETARVDLPVPRATSCAFGGGLRDLYVTTASVGMTEAQIEAAVDSGDLFRARVDVPGLPANVFGRDAAGG